MIKHGLSQDYMVEHFVTYGSVHSLKKRSSEKGVYVIPKVKGCRSKSFSLLRCCQFRYRSNHFIIFVYG